ncbi:MAG: preprotein translocase subunit SecY [Ilumatobacteraceae bacterium]|nr:preprotein translocase subunit SecY [Actinomycetota bacterium]MDP4648750.1 preprotein translocase subunit SecY [Ilumatobacteraceae bacterium]MDA3019637.1 preprotein translocase subunit SecY [Actinomycetota bacterium]MDP4705425.1 preprotein translocase subunit SecY [Ilumatobacteraceae bacterium]MDP4713179.1 preprotein translocase subunit SecY [Ilumatobacteraceae bacterium]
MLSNLKNIFKVPDLRNKILFTVMMVLLYRLGAHIRVPGIDDQAVRQLRESAREQGALGFLNLFSGGAFSSFAIFALGIMPYITSSIIMQVLTVVIPKLEEWQQEGATGQRKITQWTRYVAIAIATLQGAGLTFIFGQGNGSAFFTASTTAPDIVLLPDGMWPRGLLVIISLVAGTALLMWMGELISQRGIGNGMSILIFASVVSSLPFSYYSILQSKKWVVFAILVTISIGILIAVVRVELGQRRIPVQFAKRVVGRRMYGGQSTYIPLKVNQAGIVPIIFASSVMLLPVLVTNVIGGANGWRRTVTEWVDRNLVSSQGMLYIVSFALLIVAFAYFYNSIAFDPIRQADQIRRQGGFIPGIRPGPQTERYLAKTVNRITLPGALFVAFIAILPYIVLWVGDVQSFPFAGTTVLIAVGVALELMRQVNSQLMLRNYEGFLK